MLPMSDECVQEATLPTSLSSPCIFCEDMTEAHWLTH